MSTANQCASGASTDDDDYPAPDSWSKPSWWRAEFDEAVPLARYVIYSQAQGRQQLRKHRDPSAHKDVRKASEARRNALDAPAKVAHFTESIAYYEARVTVLSYAAVYGAKHANRDDGTPHDAWWDVEKDLRQAQDQLARAQRALKKWAALAEQSPAVHPPSPFTAP
jgi:hypothetical protein